MITEYFDKILKVNGYSKYEEKEYRVYINNMESKFIVDYQGGLVTTRFLCMWFPDDIHSPENMISDIPLLLCNHGFDYLCMKEKTGNCIYDGEIKDIKQFFRKKKIEKILSY